MHRHKRLALALFLALSVLGGSLVIGLIPFQVDDSYITFRYARSLAQGHGFAFNPSGPWVEGFSSPAWLLLLVAAAGLFGHSAIPAAAIIIGFLCYLFCIYWLSEPDSTPMDWRRPHVGNLLALALFISSPAFFYYSVTGLETLLFLLAVLIFSRAAVGSARLAAGISCGFLAPWIRPEGPWLIPMLVIVAAVMDPRHFLRERRFRLLAGSVIAGGILLTSFRLWFFGQPFPNTYYAKPMVMRDAALYIRNSFWSAWPLLLLLLAVLGAIFGQRRHRGYLFASFSWMLAAFLEGGDWMPHGRMLVPAFGLMCLAASGIGGLFVKQGYWLRLGRIAVMTATLIAFGFGLKVEAGAVRFARNAMAKTVYVEEMLISWINESGARSVASVDIGMLGYYFPGEIFDLAGLTDKRIAHSPGPHLGKVFSRDYFFVERRPDLFIVRTSAKPGILPRDHSIQNTGSDIEMHLAADPRLAGDYRFIVSFYTSDPRTGWYGKLVFARSDIIIPERLVPPDRIIYLAKRPIASSA